MMQQKVTQIFDKYDIINKPLLMCFWYMYVHGTASLTHLLRSKRVLHIEGLRSSLLYTPTLAVFEIRPVRRAMIGNDWLANLSDKLSENEFCQVFNFC